MAQRACDSCRNQYEAKRPNSRFCSEPCRKRFSRQPGAVASLAVPADEPASHEGPLTRSTRLELEAAGRVDSSIGQLALLAARRLDAGGETGSAVASLMREHRATVAEAVRGVQMAGDKLDELRAKRDRKLAAG